MSVERFGRYEIKAELGRGGMATVYHAFDPRFKRDVALKVLPREFLHDPTFRARFEHEAHIIATLEHSAIVPVHDFGEEEGQPYLVMRFLTGGSLLERMKRGPLPLTETAAIFERIASALDEAHRHGIIHRDLKPGNILFDALGEAYLSDFGIAKLAEGTTTFTGTGIVGTPAYMSPEQALGRKDIDGRSDIYSLGVILFELLTHQAPYESDTPMGLAMAHLTQPVPEILKVKPDLPLAADMLIRRAMAKEREERYQSAGELAQAVGEIALGRHDTVPAIGAKTVVEPHPSRQTVVEPLPPRIAPPPPVFAAQPTQPAAAFEPAPVALAPRRSLAGLWITLALIALSAIGGLIGMQLNGFGLPLFKPTDTPTPTATLTPTPTPTFLPPTISLISPAENKVNLVLGQPLVVQFVANAVSGVARVDLSVNGELKDARQGDGVDKSLATQFEWIPPDEGAYLISVEVFGRDGSSSSPATFSVLVVKPTATATSRPSNTPAPTATTTATVRASTGGGTSGGSSGGTSTGARSVDGTFTSSATNVSAGQQVTVSWDLKANQDFIFSAELWERAIGATGFNKYTLATNVKQSSDSRAFAPTTTTSYELHIFYNDKSEQAAQQTKTVTVTVGGVGVISPTDTPTPTPTSTAARSPSAASPSFRGSASAQATTAT